MTLIEYCLTVALLAFIMTLGLNASMIFYRGTLSHNETLMLASSIEEARDAALYSEIPHTLTLPPITFDTSGSISSKTEYMNITIEKDGSIIY